MRPCPKLPRQRRNPLPSIRLRRGKLPPTKPEAELPTANLRLRLPPDPPIRLPYVPRSWPAGLAEGWSVVARTKTVRRFSQGRAEGRASIPADPGQDRVVADDPEALREDFQGLDIARAVRVLRTREARREGFQGLGMVARAVLVPVVRFPEARDRAGREDREVSLQGRAVRVPEWVAREQAHRLRVRCRRTRGRRSEVSRRRNRRIHEGKKSLRCRKNSCKPRRR